jgi:methyltransferase (TIGR00027 family)
MKKDHSSRTAAYVGWLRALGDRGLTSADGFTDPPARSLLWPGWAQSVAWVAPVLEHLPSVMRARVIAHVDVLVCRSLAIDAEVTKAIGAGCTQLVVLGAGFDDRAHRMRELASVRVFEVDHPATQATKRARAAALPRVCRELTYAACDFERDLLGERLAAAGHRTDQQTVWIWEGVTLYLRDQAIQDTLAQLAARSAPGSRLVVEYHEPGISPRKTPFAILRALLLALWSEPQIGRRPRQVIQAELEGAGLSVEDDFALSPRGTAFRTARLAIAVRAGTGRSLRG